MNHTNDVLQTLGYDIPGLTLRQVKNRIEKIDNNVHLIRSEQQRINSQIRQTEARVNENNEIRYSIHLGFAPMVPPG